MSDTTADRIEQELAEAKAAKEAASARIEELTALRSEMRPTWRRLTIRRVENSFGEEYDLVPKRWGTT